MNASKELTKLHKFGGEEIEVVFRKLQKKGPTMMHYEPFQPGVTTENGVICERDVAVPVRDGTTIYIDIYRPEGATKLPAIVCWSPFGKRHYYSTTPIMLALGVPPGTISRWAKFEAPDPAYWCYHGYAVINPEARGAGNSQGDIYCFGTQEGRDGYDLIEWLAGRDWSNGKVGMAGNSWLAMTQWLVAAERPPHLTCIAPWQGCGDIYREFVCMGGVPEIGFNNFLLDMLNGPGSEEDYVAMAFKYPLINAYWEDKIPQFQDIEIPAYVTAGWSHFHLRGSVEGFRRIASPKKWIRFHRDFEWPDMYTPKNIEDLQRFFDRYLKEIHNGWEMTPRVRLDVMDARDIDYQTRRAEKEFPLERTQYRKLFLDASNSSLSFEPVANESSTRYEATKGQAAFTLRFDKDTELTGYMKLRLWVAAEGTDDMDLFVAVQKADEKGNFIPTFVLDEPHPGAPGLLRVSHRELDEKMSTPHQPVHTHRREQRLKPKEIVPVDIEIWPTSKLWHAGQQLRVVVSGHYVREPGWFEPFAWETRNKGNHIIYTGGKYDSHLLVPEIPPKYTAGAYVQR
ncbi:MAG: CocE/NonD family hydrolase [Xanthobacteraceae bacterium]